MFIRHNFYMHLRNNFTFIAHDGIYSCRVLLSTRLFQSQARTHYCLRQNTASTNHLS